MSEEGGHGHGHGGGLIEANHSWAFSNFDNSGGCSNGKCGNKPPDSSSNNPIEVAPRPLTIATKKRRRYGVSKNGSGGDGKECKTGDGDSDHEIHIWTERERRKKMRTMFANLHALLPDLPAKADKSTIVDEAVSRIKILEQTLQKLQKQKLEMLRSGSGTSTGFEPSSSSSIVAPPVLALESRESFLADQGFSNSSSNNNLAITSSNSSNSFGVPHFPICLQTWSSPNVVLNVCGNDAQICVWTPKKPGLLANVCYVLEKYKLEVITANISSDNYQSMYMIHARVNGAADQFSEALPGEEIFKLAVGEMIYWFSS